MKGEGRDNPGQLVAIEAPAVEKGRGGSNSRVREEGKRRGATIE
jgi:hypothetical protein